VREDLKFTPDILSVGSIAHGLLAKTLYCYEPFLAAVGVLDESIAINMKAGTTAKIPLVREASGIDNRKDAACGSQEGADRSNGRFASTAAETMGLGTERRHAVSVPSLEVLERILSRDSNARYGGFVLQSVAKLLAFLDHGLPQS